MADKGRRVLGWCGVVITVLITGFWSYWGSFEFFHEGCYSKTFLGNVSMYFLQYMPFSIIPTLFALAALRFKKTGLVLHLLLGLFCVFFFNAANSILLVFLLVVPFTVMGLFYCFGNPVPLKWAYRFIIAVPLIIVTAISIPQSIKVSQRFNDGNTQMQIVEGNGVTLIWAPRGPGWPDQGVTWLKAHEICKYLSEDGTVIMADEQNIWRLPTADEGVRSLMLHGKNAGGVWYPEKQEAVYNLMPDKESPLWDVYSKVIYYWTEDAAPKDNKRAYILVYNGNVAERDITSKQDYLSFRAVKEVEKEP